MKKNSILIIENDIKFRETIESILLSNDYETFSVNSTQQAEDFISKNTPDIILLDLTLPNETGKTFLREQHLKYPIIVMIDENNVDAALDCMRAGAVDLLQKPFRAQRLLEAIERNSSNEASKIDIEGTILMNGLPKKLAGYKIIRVIGEGNIGIVYQVEDQNGHIFALKVLKLFSITQEEHENVLLRFETEAKAASLVLSNNVIKVLDYGYCEKNNPYILMEYFNGIQLGELLDQNSLSMEKKYYLFSQILQGLVDIHEQGICHRDVKPSNLLVNKKGLVKVSDFGTARLKDSTITHTSEVFGTPSYLSPEAFISAKVDERSDIYSLGTVAYELFTGVKAYKGPNIISVARQIQESKPASIKKIAPDVPPKIEQMINKMMHKKAHKRYQSVKAISTELDLIIESKSPDHMLKSCKDRLQQLQH